jgi:uncharacterized membrane protein YdjX (TVP38/TMEM64 family)
MLTPVISDIRPRGAARWLRLALAALLLVVLLVVFELTGWRDQFNLNYLRGILHDHPYSGLLIFTLAFIAGNLIQIPGWIFLAAAVLALGQLWGGVAVFIAASISCLVSFLLIRAVGGDALRQLDGRLARRVLAHLDQRPVASIAAARMLFQTLPALNYALAMSGVRLRPYMLGTLLGLPLPISLYCLLFDFLARFLHIG